MTVVYTDKIASRGGFGSFWSLLARWRGSVYKMVWKDMLIYAVVYYIISFTYRFGLNPDQKKVFEMVVVHCARFRTLIPVSFVLGFFVTLVVNRWWGTYQSLPWPDTTAILLTSLVPGQDAESKKVKATVIRYVNLAIAMTFSMVSPAVKRKLPTLNSYMNEGYLTEEEVKIIDVLENRNTMHKAWIPIMWACKLVNKARENELISSDSHQKTITMEILNVRGRCGGLLGWNEYNIPLVYTQVVTIAVYSFFLFSLIGEQFLDPTKGYDTSIVDLYVPIFALLQLFFYVGWIKVGEALLNPFGEDDHDFEFIPLLSRHREISAMLSDQDQDDLPLILQKPDDKTPIDHHPKTLDLQTAYKDSNDSLLSPAIRESPMSPSTPVSPLSPVFKASSMAHLNPAFTEDPASIVSPVAPLSPAIRETPVSILNPIVKETPVSILSPVAKDTQVAMFSPSAEESPVSFLNQTIMENPQSPMSSSDKENGMASSSPTIKENPLAAIVTTDGSPTHFTCQINNT